MIPLTEVGPRRWLGAFGVAALLATTVLASGSRPASADAGTLFQVRGPGATFNAQIPLDSAATYQWTPGQGVAHEWLTTTAGTRLDQRLARQPDVSMAAVSDAIPAITVDSGVTYQTMKGFGAALTDSAASLIAASPYRDSMMEQLFSGSGARLNLVRLPMGASDLAVTDYDYDTMPLGMNDPELRQFSVAHDTAYIIPLLLQARGIRPDLSVIAAPWSAPGWMKTGGTFHGMCIDNTLNPAWYSVYAQYFVKFLIAYRSSYGLPVDLVSLQNEPNNCNWSYATMNMGPAQEAALAGQLRTALNAAGLASVGILGWDHNWYDGSSPTTYPQALMQQASASVSSIGYHCYNGTGPGQLGPAVESEFHQGYPGVDIYMTECSGFNSASNSASNLVWEFRNALIGPIRNYARASLYWSLALRTDGGPHIGGCGDCRGMIAIDGPTGAYSLSEDYYYWSHFSKFVEPGAVRIASTDLNNGSIETVAFRNPNGSIVLVAVNSSATETDYRGHIVQWSGDTNAQKTSWLVGPDGHRRWIPDVATYNCLKAGGAPGPDVLPASTLDAVPDLNGVWAVCGAARLGVNSMLQSGFHMRSSNGQYLFTLNDANLSLTGVAGPATWSSGRGGDDLILQADGNLVEYAGGGAVWASGTAGSGAVSLALRDDGKLALYDGRGNYVWTSEGPPSRYVNHIVQYDGDTKAQKTAWLVGPDQRRRWIPDVPTYDCLKSRGISGPDALTSWELDQMPDLNGVWATC